jgi:hypothetical protein
VQAEVVAVRLLGLPVGLHLRSSQHAQELEREFALITEQVRRDGAGTLPPRLLEVVGHLRGRYSTFGQAQEAALDAAVAAGQDQVDLDFEVPAHAGMGAVTLGSVLAEADRYCQEGRHLLTLAMPADLLTYRHWYLQQFIDQTAGLPAQPWTGPLH